MSGYANLANATGAAQGQDVLNDFYGMLAVGGHPSDGDARYTFNAFSVHRPVAAGTIAIDGGPLTFTNPYQGAPLFVNVIGASSATIKAVDDSGLLMLGGLAIRL